MKAKKVLSRRCGSSASTRYESRTGRRISLEVRLEAGDAHAEEERSKVGEGGRMVQ